MAIGYKLTWEKIPFKGSEIFECAEFPSVVTWIEEGSQYLRIGEKLYETPGGKVVDFKKAEEFIVKKFKKTIEDFEKRSPYEDHDDQTNALLKELTKLNLLVQCMFK